MRRTITQTARVTFLGALLALSASCSRHEGGSDAPAGPTNRAPVIGTLSALPMSVVPGENANIAVSASDPDGHALTYAWSATGGAIVGSGAQVTWQSPGAPGTFTISVTVSDGQLSDQGSVNLAVVTPNGLLSGVYSFAGFEHDFTDSHHVAVTGTLTFDGAGAYTSAMTVNADGTIESQAPASTYSLNAAGDLTLDDGSGGTLAGGLDAAHEVAVVSRITPARHPLIVIAVKRSGTFSQFSLSGDYHVAAYHWDGGGGTPAYAALTGVGTFDPAAGTFNFTATNNWGGAVFPVSLETNYAVASDGTLTLSDPAGSGVLFKGGVMTGGDIMVGASTSAGGKPMMLVALRKSGTFTANSLAGPHRTLSIGPSGAGVSSWIGDRIFDGGSDWTASGTLNDNGTVSSTYPEGTYSVTPEGHLTLTALPRVYLLGVREAGAAAAGAAITSGEAPRFVFSVRK